LAGKLGPNLKSFNIVVFMQLTENILEEKWGTYAAKMAKKGGKVKLLNFDFCCNFGFRILSRHINTVSLLVGPQVSAVDSQFTAVSEKLDTREIFLLSTNF
jgi:hypothetical protein